VTDSMNYVVTNVTGVPEYSAQIMSSKGHDFALVIPVINENGKLTRQLAHIAELVPQVDVIIADGGSTDGSTDPGLLAQLGVTAVLTKNGPGKLSAQLRMAFHFCLKSGYRGVLTMDGNGKDGVAGINSIVLALTEGYDFVQGSRFLPGGKAINTPRGRLLAIRLLHAPVTSIAAHCRFTDTTNGFRGHSRKLLEDVDLDPLRDVFDSYELLAYIPIQASRLGFRITEVPVTRSYPSTGPIPTKIHGLRAYVHMCGILIKAAFGRYSPQI
jgi:dolichol-phosphate mannosyltransferase